MSAWVDKAGSSRMPDGSKIGEFCIDGHWEWWAYPTGWTPRGNIQALGPFNSRQEAKVGMTSYLGIGE